MTVSVAWVQASTYPAAADRWARNGIMGGTAAANITPRDGVILDYAAAMSTSSAGGMNLSVSVGQAMISGYLFTVAATETVVIPAGGTTARTDIVVARVRDTEAGDAVGALSAVESVQGTPDGAAPAVPARALLLATVSVPANTSVLSSANLTDNRVLTVAAGGINPVPFGTASTPAQLNVPQGAAIYDPNAQVVAVANSSGTWDILRSTPFQPSYHRIGGIGGALQLPRASWQTVNAGWGEESASPANATSLTAAGLAVSVSGFYLVSAQLNYTPQSGGGLIVLGVGVGSAPVDSECVTVDPGNGTRHITATFAAAAGRTIGIWVYHTQAAALVLQYRSLTALRIG